MGRKRQPTPEQYCQQCGTRLERKDYNGRLEELANFKRRKYCNQTCMAIAFVSDAPCEGVLHRRARRFLGTSCEFCGVTTRLQAHHRDTNVQNNSPENIQTLCISCHASYHHRVRRVGAMAHGNSAYPVSSPQKRTAPTN